MGFRMPENKMDSVSSAWFTRQLEHVKKQTYDIQFADLKARDLFPISFESHPGDETIVYYQYDRRGFAKVIANYSDDLPKVELSGKEFISRIKGLGVSYEYTMDDKRKAQKTGTDLKGKKAFAAKRAVMELENEIAFFGDEKFGIKGFLDQPNIPVVVAAKTFAASTPDEILKELNDAASGIVARTKGVESGNTLLLPITQFNLINDTPRSATSDTTILQHFLKNQQFVKEVTWVDELQGAGTGGTDVMVCYNRDPEKLEMQVPMDFLQHPEQFKSLKVEVPCEERFGGVLVYYPLSIVFVEGI